MVSFVSNPANIEELRTVVRRLGVFTGVAARSVAAETAQIIENLVPAVDSALLNPLLSHEELSERCAAAGVLPMFGFPTRDRSLYDSTAFNLKEISDAVATSRSLDQAITMFAPGSRVVKDKQDHFGIGFAHWIMRKGKPVSVDPLGHRLQLARCRDCSVVLAIDIWAGRKQELAAEVVVQEICPGCGQMMDKFDAYQPLGFRTDYTHHDYDSGVDAFMAPPMSSLARVPSGVTTTAVGSTSVELLEENQVVSMNDNHGRFFSSVRANDSTLVVINEEPYVDKIYDVVSSKFGSLPRQPRNDYAIVDILTTDVLVLTPDSVSIHGGIVPTDPEVMPAGMSAFASFAQMLIRACKDYLQIDQTELRMGLQPFSSPQGVSQRIFISDVLENGSGYSKIISNPTVLRSVLTSIINVTGSRLANPNFHPECDTSCPSCLRSYENSGVFRWTRSCVSSGIQLWRRISEN